MLAAQSPGVSLIIPSVAHLEPDFVDVVALRRLAPGLIAPMHVVVGVRKRSDARLSVPLPGAGFRVPQSLLGGSGVPLLAIQLLQGLAIQAPPDGRPALGKRGARRRRAGIQGILPIMLGRWRGSSLAAEVAIMGRLCRQAMAAGNPGLGAPDPCVDRGCGAYPLLEQCGRRPTCVRRRVRVEGIPKGWPIACEGVQGLVCPATWQGLCEDNCSGPIHNAATKHSAGLPLAVQASIVPLRCVQEGAVHRRRLARKVWCQRHNGLEGCVRGTPWRPKERARGLGSGDEGHRAAKSWPGGCW